MPFIPLRLWAKPKPITPPVDSNVLLRSEIWMEFKRLHLEFLQTLNARTYGHSTSMGLMRQAMLVSFEARKLCGAHKENAPDLTLTEQISCDLNICMTAYNVVTDETFNDKSLSNLAIKLDFNMIEIFLDMTGIQFHPSDRAIIETLEANNRTDTDRLRRFSDEIFQMNKTLSSYFLDMDRWTTPT